MHLRFVPVFAQLFGDEVLVYLELHYNKALAEILQQQPQENAYNQEPFHGANLVNNCQSGIHYNGFIIR